MKRILLLILTAALLTACGSKEEEPKKVEVKKEPELTVSESKVSFHDFTIEIEKAKIKDGKLILNTRYHNDSYEEPRAFMASASLEVKQGDEILNELSGIEQDPKGNYYYKNKTGINAPVEFEYDLENEVDEITVNISPTDWDQESKAITITIQ